MPKITHGPHIGRITSSGVRIWLRLEKEGYARIQYAPGSTFNDEISEEELSENFKEKKKLDRQEIHKEDDYIITIDITGLEVNTEYVYVVEVSNDGEDYSEQPIKGKLFGYFKTFPEVGNLQDELVFAFGSCFHPYMKGDQIFEGLDKKSQEEKGFRFLLLIGDQIYADYVPKRFAKENVGTWKFCAYIPYILKYKEAVDFEAFKHVYRKFWSSTPFRHALMKIPSFMTFDDHEFRNGWGSRGENRKPAGSKIGRRRVAALKAYDLYQHTLNPKTNANKYWYHFNFGDIGFFVLDTRSSRDKKDGIILDGNQMEALKKWLEDKNENYKLKFIISSVPIVHISFPKIVDFFFPADARDHWSGFKTQRQDLIKFIFDKKIEGVHFLSGDIHMSHIARITKKGNKNKEIFSFTSSPFAQESSKLQEYIALKDDLGNQFELTQIFKGAGKNFGVVRISPPKNDNDDTIRNPESPPGRTGEIRNSNYEVSYELYDKLAKQFFRYPGKATIVLDVNKTISTSRTLKKNSEPYPDASRVVNLLHEKFGVVYLTNRPRFLPHVGLVRHWLRENGFPASQIIMMMKPWRIFCPGVYKYEMIKDMIDNQFHTPVIGIGDRKTDAIAYKRNKMISLIIHKDSSGLPDNDVYIINPDSEFSIWKQIEDTIFNKITVEEINRRRDKLLEQQSK